MLRHLLFGSKPRRNFSGFCPRPNAFSRSALQVIDSRPRVTLPAAASSTNSGREQTTSPYRTKDTDRLVAEICQRRSVCPLPTRGAKAGQDISSRLWPNAAIPALFPFSTTLPQPFFFCYSSFTTNEKKNKFLKKWQVIPRNQ